MQDDTTFLANGESATHTTQNRHLISQSITIFRQHIIDIHQPLY
jgi:hypothetical protein